MHESDNKSDLQIRLPNRKGGENYMHESDNKSDIVELVYNAIYAAEHARDVCHKHYTTPENKNMSTEAVTEINLAFKKRCYALDDLLSNIEMLV